MKVQKWQIEGEPTAALGFVYAQHRANGVYRYAGYVAGMAVTFSGIVGHVSRISS